MPCPVALAKEARNNIVDKRRSKRIAAIMLTVSDSDESSESSSSKYETSAMENSDGEQTKFMLEVSLISFLFLEGTENLTEEQKKKKQMQKESSDLLVQLTKCIRVCKRKVETMSPKVFLQPNLSKLRHALEITHFVSKEIRLTSITATTALHLIAQRASVLANRLNIADNVNSRYASTTLDRLRTVLAIAARVADVIRGYTLKIASGDFESLPQESRASAPSNDGSTEMKGVCGDKPLTG